MTRKSPFDLLSGDLAEAVPRAIECGWKIQPGCFIVREKQTCCALGALEVMGLLPKSDDGFGLKFNVEARYELTKNESWSFIRGFDGADLTHMLDRSFYDLGLSFRRLYGI